MRLPCTHTRVGGSISGDLQRLVDRAKRRVVVSLVRVDRREPIGPVRRAFCHDDRCGRVLRAQLRNDWPSLAAVCVAVAGDDQEVHGVV